MFGTILPPLPFPFCACVLCSSVNRLGFVLGLGFFLLSPSFPLPWSPRLCARSRRCITRVAVVPLGSGTEGPWAAAHPPRLWRPNSAAGFQPEQCQSCGIGFSGSSEPVTKGVCCADLVPPSCCDGLIRYFMLWGFFVEGMCEFLIWILSNVFVFCLDRLGFLQNSLSH